jgi:hypothetical protein
VSATQGVQAVPPVGKGTAILAICPDKEDLRVLRGMLSGSRWTLSWVRTCQEAVTFLRRQRLVFLVVCEQDVRDGNWKDVLEEVAVLPAMPLLIVISLRGDDRLWCEVLDLGGTTSC